MIKVKLIESRMRWNHVPTKKVLQDEHAPRGAPEYDNGQPCVRDRAYKVTHCNLKCQGYGNQGKNENLLHIWENMFQVEPIHYRRYLWNNLSKKFRLVD